MGYTMADDPKDGYFDNLESIDQFVADVKANEGATPVSSILPSGEKIPSGSIRGREGAFPDLGKLPTGDGDFSGIGAELMDIKQAVTENPGNLIERLEEAEREQRAASVADVVVDDLSDLSPTSGETTTGRTIYGEGVPEDGNFTGVAIIHPPWVDALGREWSIVRMEDGVIQFGVGRTGVFIGQGQLTIDPSGISSEGIAWAILLHALNEGYERFGRIGFFLPGGSDVPALGMNYGGAAGESMVENGDFETGDLSNWTESGTGSASVISPGHTGDYCAEIVGSPSTSKVLTSDRIAVSDDTMYSISAWVKIVRDSEAPSGRIRLRWYDHPSAGALLRTDTIYISSAPAFAIKSGAYRSPSGAQSVAVALECSGGTVASTLTVDDVAFGEQALSRTIYFDPDLKYSKDGVDLLEVGEDFNLVVGNYQMDGADILKAGSSIQHEGMNYNRTSGGSYSSYETLFEVVLPIMVYHIDVDCHGGATYTLSLRDYYGGNTLKSFGSKLIAADPGPKEFTWTLDEPMLLYPGKYRLLMETSGARQVRDYNGGVPRYFGNLVFLTSQYGGSTINTYTHPFRFGFKTMQGGV